MPYYI